MKKTMNIKWMLLLAFLLPSVFVSCSDDEEEVPSGERVVIEDVDIASTFNHLEYLQSQFVKLDEDGELINRYMGKPLNPADETILYIGVNDLNEAKSLFKSWIIDSENIYELGDVMKASFKDYSGTFDFAPSEKVTNYGQEVAVATCNGIEMEYVSQVVFVTVDSWPENAESIYKYGDVVKGHKDHNWVCVREATAGQCGYLFSKSSKKSEAEGTTRFSADYIPEEGAAKSFVSYLNGNWSKHKKTINDSGIVSISDNEWLWYDDWVYAVFEAGVYRIRIPDGKISYVSCWESMFTDKYEHHDLYVDTFGTLD